MAGPTGRSVRAAAGPRTLDGVAVDDVAWDAQTWHLVWERTLSHAERHEIGMAVLRRRVPADPFERRLARELAKRWERHALWLMVLYALWTAFWGAVGWHSVGVRGLHTAALPVICAAIGAASILLCLTFRRRLRVLGVALEAP